MKSITTIRTFLYMGVILFALFALFLKLFTNAEILRAGLLSLLLTGITLFLIKLFAKKIIRNSTKNIRVPVSTEFQNLKKKPPQKKDIANLEKQIQFRKEFLGNVSHELKTPLFSVQGYIETLLDGGLYDDKINKNYLKKASKNIDRLSAIVSDIDMINKIESSALELEIKNFNIVDLINESKESLELLANKEGISIIFQPDKKSYRVKADRKRIKEILINLITNSIKYGRKKGETNIAILNSKNNIIVRVSDNGIGIKKEQLPRIFERFYRIDGNRSREQGGSGLGLAIVKHLIEAHEQIIDVKSEFGVGSTFEFTLEKVE